MESLTVEEVFNKMTLLFTQAPTNNDSDNNASDILQNNKILVIMKHTKLNADDFGAIIKKWMTKQLYVV